MLIKVYPFSNLFHDWEYLIQCLKINYGIKRHLSFEAQNLEKIVQLRTKYDTEMENFLHFIVILIL